MIRSEDEVGLFWYISTVFSALSLFTSVVALFPQVVQNYRNKSVEGLSLLFLASWFIGDTVILLGAILTKQLSFQIILAIYHLSNDIFICGQYYYYSILSKTNLWKVGHHSLAKPSNSKISMISGLLTLVGNIGKANALQNNDSTNSTLGDHQTLGYSLSWLGAAFYIISRLPQLFKNYNRKSTDGISPSLFWMIIISNITYIISILTSVEFITSENPQKFINNELPFILGNSGTILFDLIYFFQHYYLYRGNRLYKEIDDEVPLETIDQTDVFQFLNNDKTELTKKSTTTTSPTILHGEDIELTTLNSNDIHIKNKIEKEEQELNRYKSNSSPYQEQ